MVHIDGEPQVSCQIPAASLTGKAITTIEGVAKNPHPVIDAFLAGQVTQCGYCQPGMIMSIISLLRKIPEPSDADIDQALARNLCRCGAYQRVRRAVHAAVMVLEGNALLSGDC
jgi:aerobic-type carbon monoxide dehydrogenase small subunit (CoxS/CutS family)